MNASVDLAPLLRLLGLASLVALLPLSWVWLRRPGARPGERLAALTTLTLFLTFDLVVFGAFTRLTDSGLGCPDWPGCYGSASPLGARAHIESAQSAMPGGPVTPAKAWIEMIHRYLAMTVGALILVMAVASVRERRHLPHSPAWALATLVWVLIQGLFGKYTVTLKLYPAIVTLHLLGGLVLLLLLVLQRESFGGRRLELPPALRRAAWAVLALLAVQVALGGWVSTNYAVLACSGFPACNGRWWPDAAFAEGFTLLRELGRNAQGGWLSLEALVAIHLAHRAFALLAIGAAALLGLALVRRGAGGAGALGKGLLALLALQFVSGLSNVVLGWPIVAALLHSAGAAALLMLLALLLARSSAGIRRAA